MARTVYGAHKRYMETYLNVYKGYYVSSLTKAGVFAFCSKTDNNVISSQAMVLVEITKGITGFVDESMMSSTFQDTDSRLPRLKQHLLSIVRFYHFERKKPLQLGTKKRTNNFGVANRFGR